MRPPPARGARGGAVRRARRVWGEPMPIRAEQVLPGPAYFVREERFQRGDTLGGFLSRLGIADAEGARLVRLRALHQLRPGLLVRAEVGASGAPRMLSFLTGRETLVQIIAEGDE